MTTETTSDRTFEADDLTAWLRKHGQPTFGAVRCYICDLAEQVLDADENPLRLDGDNLATDWLAFLETVDLAGIAARAENHSDNEQAAMAGAYENRMADLRRLSGYVQHRA